MITNRKITHWLLIMALLLSVVLPTGAMAAAGDINSIAIEGENTTIELVVGKTKQLKVWANVEGSTSKKDVTATVTWTSSDESILRVNEGLVTAVKSGTATVKAAYSGSVSIITIKTVDTYSGLTLDYKLDGKFSLDTDESDLMVTAKAKIDSTLVEPKDVTAEAEWSTSNASVLTVDKGQLTLLGAGEAKVTAKYSGLTASFKVTVTSPYSGLKLYRSESPNTEIGEKEDLELIMDDGEIELLAKTVLANDKTTADVSDKAVWASSDSAVATVEDGKVKLLSIGKTTISASYLSNRAQVDIYVRAPYEAILLTPSEDAMIFFGETLKVEAGVRSSANTTEDISSRATWTSSNKLIATVNSDGLVVAKAVGSTTIKASFQGITKSFKLVVSPTITKLEVEKDELELFKGESVKLPGVTATKIDGEKIDFSDEIVWSSNREDIATIEDGKIVTKDTDDTALSDVVTITGKLSEAGDGVTPNPAFPIRGTADSEVTIRLTVNEKVLTILVPDNKLSIVIGEEMDLPSVTAVYENGEEVANPSDIEWTLSGANAVLKTTAEGKKIKGLKKGSATLKGTYSNKTVSVSLTIEPKIKKLVVASTTIELNINKSKSIKVTGYYTDGKKVTLSTKMGWVSSDDKIATVSTSSVKAVAEGSVTLTGSYQGQTVTVKVNVVPKLKKLEVSEKKLELVPGSAKTLVLKATYDTGKVADVTSSAVWTSSKPAAAKVTAGKIEAVAKGTSSVKAKYGGKTVTIRVSVKVK
ncbi:Ig-like domain-containing protein [Paenibacillus sanguinis]|uniref:Ig-like domain-containing protein n=1 Tax=Paenibacillus sanguinis TaxID=225906 RepID=UPI000361559A|nr:Ig-like domain-containing protein [Paenibacillus sanguinis]